jgi:hypothetical protein
MEIGALEQEIMRQEKIKASAEISLARKKLTLQNYNRTINDLQKRLELARSDLQRAKKDYEKEKEVIDSASKKISDAKKEIEKLKEKYIFLQAPGFHGEVPAYGKIITYSSVNEISEEQVNNELIKLGLEAMIKAGYKHLDEFNEAIRFLLVCDFYTDNGINYELLIQDEKLKNLIMQRVV